MKLNLPKQLRAALLSAVITASATAPSFAAVIPWDITYDQDQQYATVGGSNVLDFGINNQSWGTNWSIVFTVDAASLKDESTKPLTLLGVKLTQTNNGTTTTKLAEGATMSNDNGADKLALKTWNDVIERSITIPESGDITFVLSRNGGNANNLSLKMYNLASSTAPITTLNSTQAQNFSNTLLAGVVFGGKGSYEVGGNANQFADDDVVGSYKIKKAGYSFGSAATDSDVGTFNNANILTWNGGASGNWSDTSWSKVGTTEQQSFTASDSVIFATENATVALSSATSASTAEIRETTTFNLGSNELTVGSVAIVGGKTLNLEGSSGKLIVDNFTLEAGSTGVGTVHAKEGTSIELAGSRIENTTIQGELILKGNTFVTLGGTVTLDSVKNDLTGGGTYHYSLEGSGATLKFTGTSDLTKKSNGSANANSRIGLDGASSIIIGAEASLTTYAILNSTNWTADNNASLTVERNENGDRKGSLSLSGDSYVKSLNNAGVITSAAAIHSYQNITNTGELTAASLRIRNKDNTVSSLGGTVTVTNELHLYDGGTTNVAGSVKAGRVNATGYNSANGTGPTLGGEAKTGDKNNTLEINGATDSTANLILTGSFGIKKTGSGTQTFSGNTSGYSGAIDVSGNGTLNLAQMGETSGVTQIAISGAGALGLYSGTTTTPSTDNESTVTMGSGGSLTVGELGGTLNANLVMNAGSILKMDATLMLGSSLTLNGATLQGGLLNQLLSRSGTVTLFEGVDALTIGANSVDLSADRDFEAAEVITAFGLNDEVAALFADDPETGKPAITMNYVAGANGSGGSITMTSNVPEPATATLSLLALAALAARRRRK